MIMKYLKKYNESIFNNVKSALGFNSLPGDKEVKDILNDHIKTDDIKRQSSNTSTGNNKYYRINNYSFPYKGSEYEVIEHDRYYIGPEKLDNKGKNIKRILKNGEKIEVSDKLLDQLYHEIATQYSTGFTHSAGR